MNQTSSLASGHYVVTVLVLPLTLAYMYLIYLAQKLFGRAVSRSVGEERDVVICTRDYIHQWLHVLFTKLFLDVWIAYPEASCRRPGRKL